MILSTRLSPTQLINLWSELVDCYYDHNSYGGRLAEIYAWTLLPYNPFAAKGRGHFSSEAKAEQAKYAGDALAEVLSYFCHVYECKAVVDGESFVGTCEPFNHRVHVLVNH